MRYYRCVIMKSMFVVMIGFIFSIEVGFAAQVEIFTGGLNSPTGLAINTETRELYVNCGANGNFWAIAINNDGSSGGINLITSNFTPKMDIALDSQMNVYGVEHGTDYIYRIATTGGVSESKIGYNEKGTGIAIESPGLSSNYIFYSLENENMEAIYISSYEANGYISRDERFYVNDSMRFMEWRKGLNEMIGTHGDQVVSINPSNGSTNTIASGFVSPYGITQDNSGNIYIADSGGGTITQISSLGTITTIVSGLNCPIGLAYDSETNKLFVSEKIEGNIYSIDMGSENICPQVVTFAQNPVTHQWAAFPTLCDVPLGWETSENVPSWYSSDEDPNIYPPINDMDIDNPDAFLILNNDAAYTAPYGTSTCIYGSSDSNNLKIEKGATVDLQNFPGANTIQVASLTRNFSVYRSGTVTTFEDTYGTTITIPATTTFQTIVFEDRSLELSIIDGQVMLSSQVIQVMPRSIN